MSIEPVPTCEESPLPLAPSQVAGRTLPSPLALLAHLLLGIFLGIIFVRTEVVSWYRIQEMFRFDSFHLFGVIGTALLTAGTGITLIRRRASHSLAGAPIQIEPKAWGDSRIPGARYWMGGSIFGLGWGLLGACPGPIFALVGGGYTIMVVPLLAALAGTWSYAVLRDHLPH